MFATELNKVNWKWLMAQNKEKEMVGLEELGEHFYTKKEPPTPSVAVSKAVPLYHVLLLSSSPSSRSSPLHPSFALPSLLTWKKIPSPDSYTRTGIKHVPKKRTATRQLAKPVSSEGPEEAML